MSAAPCPTCGGNRTEAFSASKTVTIPVFVPVEEVITRVETETATTLLTREAWRAREVTRTETTLIGEATRTATEILVPALTATETTTRAETVVAEAPVRTTVVCGWTETLTETEAWTFVPVAETTLTLVTLTATTEIPAEAVTSVRETEVVVTTVSEVRAETVATEIAQRVTAAVRTTLTQTSWTGEAAWLEAGTVITLEGVDDEADLVVNGEAVGHARANGKIAPPDYVAGRCQWVVPQAGFYRFGIGAHSNSFGGPSSPGEITLEPAPSEVIDVAGTFTAVVTEYDYETRTLVTETALTLTLLRTMTTLTLTETLVDVGDGETTVTETATETLTETTQLRGVRVPSGTTAVWTDTLVCGVRTYKGATETRVIFTETTTATLTQTYVPVETETTTLTFTETETALTTILFERLLWETETELVRTREVEAFVLLATLTETETTTRAQGVAFIPCTCHECFGGIYRGTQPIERVHARGSDIACVRNSTRPHRFIF